MAERLRNGFHLLLVEDNADLREVLELALTLKGYSIACAKNGMHGLAMMKSWRRGLPDLVITDLQMPGEGDGWWLRKNMLNDDELVSIPVVVLSAAIPREAKEALQASAYLEKPVTLDLLLEVVGGTLGVNGATPGVSPRVLF